MLELKNQNQFNNFLTSYEVVIIDAWRPDCEPCKYLTPKLEEVEKILNNPKIVFATESVEVGIHRPEGYPSVYFYVKGKLYHITLGSDYPEILKILAKLYADLNYNFTDKQKELLLSVKNNSKLGQSSNYSLNNTKSLYSSRKGTSKSNYATYNNLGNV